MEQETLLPSDPREALYYITSTLTLYSYSQVFVSCEDCGPVSGLKTEGLAVSTLTYAREEFGSRLLKASNQHQHGLEIKYAMKIVPTEVQVFPVAVNR